MSKMLSAAGFFFMCKAAGVAFAAPGFGCCSVAEHPELLPERYQQLLADWEALQAAPAPRQGGFTLIEQIIDPLGAGSDLGWTVYSNSNVRTVPSIINNSPLGVLPAGTEVDAIYYIVEETDEEWLEIDYQNQTAYITRALATRPHPVNEQNLASFTDLPIGSEIVNRWWGIPIAYEPTDLAIIPAAYTLQVPGRVYQLRQDALDSLMIMIDDAGDDGVPLFVLSPYRSGPTQQSIYLNNTLPPGGNLAQRFSAPPGHSEHQLGTTVDFAGRIGGSFIDNGSPQHDWLSANAAAYGWVQTYTADNLDETGYIEEPWHWRFFGEPTASAGAVWILY